MSKLRVIVTCIDLISESVGKCFSWCIVVLIIGICYEVLMRYSFNDPTSWAYDMSFILYGALFMMAGAFTLSKGGHVRGDFLYRKWKASNQAKVDLVLYFLFFFPGILAMVIAGFGYGYSSFSLGEVSVNSPVGIPIWPLKSLIFFSGFFLFLQGTGEVLRCVICISEGSWPERK